MHGFYSNGYYLTRSLQAQVTLIGNPFLWWASTVSVAIFFCVLLFYVLRRRRQVYDLPQGSYTAVLLSLQPASNDT